MAKFSEMSLKPVVYQGQFLVGARARFFDAGGNTPKTVYQDGNLNAAFDPDEILSDANGCLPKIWISGTTAYRCIITTGGGAVIQDVDYIEGERAASSGGGGGGGTNIPTGFIMSAYSTGTEAGWVRLNARTIGNPSSGASELASDDAEALFIHLYNVDASLAVSGGRSGDAAADFAAGKQLTLPDGLLATLVGLDGMGSTPSGRFAGVTFTTGNATTLGSKVGAATITLTTAHLAAHTHTGSTDNAGAHAHSGATSTEPDHTHTASTSTTGAHSHGGATAGSGAHGHVGVTDATGDHTHTYPDAGAAVSVSTAFGGAANPTTAADLTRTTSTAGAHQHTLFISSVGDHVHTIVSDGSHAHSVTVNAAGSHFHTYSTNTVAAHLHSFTTASAGSGAAHTNVQPSLLVTYYIKL